MNRLVAAALHHPLSTRAIYLVRLSRDGLDRLLGRRDPLIPPTRLMHDGPASIQAFRTNGAEFLRYYVELGGLRPDDRMLDVGCGIGRKTVPLLSYLSDRGGYDGIDIVKTGIDWCGQHITTRRPNFRFELIDVYNRFYNPHGSQTAATYAFPFAAETFDFAVAGSVFTHLETSDAANYITETARTLKVGGRCLLSFFLINEESRTLMAQLGRFATLKFTHDLPGCYTIDPRIPERAIAFEESVVVRLLTEAGLEIERPIRYGSWCGRRQHLSWQDLVVARKIREASRPAPAP